MEKIIVAVLAICSIIGAVSAQPKVGFYNSTCPRAETIIQGIVQQRFSKDRSITAALLRMHFDDCFVLYGCDASILIDSTKSQSSEKDSSPNLTVRGFDLIDTAKQAVEAACPSTVSCADIITLVTRDAVALAGCTKYDVPTGRRDRLISDANDVNLPGPQLSISQAFSFFRAKGLTLNEMVTLLGAHTVGVAHCGFFQDRLSNFQGTEKPDPTMDKGLAATLLKICGTRSRPLSSDPTVFLDQGTSFAVDNQFYNQTVFKRGDFAATMDKGLAATLLKICGTRSRPLSSDPTVFLDQGTSFAVDNQFYNQTVFKRGILQIDQELALDRSTAPMAAVFARNRAAFHRSFADAMVKMSKIEALVGKAGDIRKNCRVFNPRKRKGGR